MEKDFLDDKKGERWYFRVECRGCIHKQVNSGCLSGDIECIDSNKYKSKDGTLYCFEHEPNATIVLFLLSWQDAIVRIILILRFNVYNRTFKEVTFGFYRRQDFAGRCRRII